MCGIGGLFIKNPDLQPRLGSLLGNMLRVLSDRGPDSAGIAIYGDPVPGIGKVVVQSSQPDQDFLELENRIQRDTAIAVGMKIISTHAVLTLPELELHRLCQYLPTNIPELRIMSYGTSVEIFKEVGLPGDVVERFLIPERGGIHGVGHTRMATESAVTTLGAHPFSTSDDQCLVHNGSLSNHNSLRRALRRSGISILSENDSEVAAAYITAQMENGADLHSALNKALVDLDGFFTFVVGTRDGFAVVRDAIACKPAVMAETDDYVAFGSEYRALVELPNIEQASVWEPEPATVYSWRHHG